MSDTIGMCYHLAYPVVYTCSNSFVALHLVFPSCIPTAHINLLFIERPISVSTETEETFTDRAQPEGSNSGSDALADDVVRTELGRKSKYPLHVAKYVLSYYHYLIRVGTNST
jgi:hypothetical protein